MDCNDRETNKQTTNNNQIYGFLFALAKLRKATISFIMSLCLSVCLSAWKSTPTGRILMKFDIGVFFENMSKILKFHKNLTRITRTLHEDLCIFITISLSFLLRMTDVPDKSCTEDQITRFIHDNVFF